MASPILTDAENRPVEVGLPERFDVVGRPFTRSPAARLRVGGRAVGRVIERPLSGAPRTQCAGYRAPERGHLPIQRYGTLEICPCPTCPVQQSGVGRVIQSQPSARQNDLLSSTCEDVNVPRSVATGCCQDLNDMKAPPGTFTA